VKRVVQTILTTDSDATLGRADRDVELTMDMGLIRFDSEKGFVIANPVYEEILMRILSSAYHDSSPPPSTWRWQKSDGGLDMVALLKEFQDFWQNHSEAWEEQADYTEAFPHLLLLGFLQRVTNGTGRVEREYAAGRGRMDIAVEYKGKMNIIEIKLWRNKKSYDTIKAKGLQQIRDYAGKYRTVEGRYLVIFDRRDIAASLDWAERLTWVQEDDVTVIGC
jgi:hypothetical protein